VPSASTKKKAQINDQAFNFPFLLINVSADSFEAALDAHLPAVFLQRRSISCPSNYSDRLLVG
jgi:hypothetical protein